MKSLKTDNYEVQVFLEGINPKDSEEIIIDNILKQVREDKNIGFAGFSDKKTLKNILERFMISWKGDNGNFKISAKEIEQVIKKSGETCKELAPYSPEKTYIFIFPCFDNFTIKKMNGLGGFCPWKDVILIFLNPQENWENSLKETIIHEFAHSISPFYKGGDFSIGEGLIFEGLAENFREKVFGGASAPYSKSLNEEEAIKTLNEIKNKLDSKDWNEYMEIFYGTKRYPLWAGYSIGYYLVRKYLKNKEKINWNELLRKNPKEILLKIIS